MSLKSIGGAIMTLAIIAAVVFAYVAIHELSYASSHPYAYGPAKIIAWGGGGGVLLSVAVGLLGYALTRRAQALIDE
jgi:hypothetical protein